MKTILVAAGLAVCLASTAYAQSRPKLLDICKFDIEQYCKSFTKKQKNQIRECLKKQEKNLLPYCQDRYKNAT